jgi:hypothetical protein
MKLNISNGKILKVNHPNLPVPVPTQPLLPPKLITEKKGKKP